LGACPEDPSKKRLVLQGRPDEQLGHDHQPPSYRYRTIGRNATRNLTRNKIRTIISMWERTLANE
jgi:hypothetical protein